VITYITLLRILNHEGTRQVCQGGEKLSAQEQNEMALHFPAELFFGREGSI
jgi:hypothetical protein